VRIGLHVPQWGEHANRRDVLDLAQAAEELGFDAVWVADHIVIPEESESRYPYRDDGVPFEPGEGFLEGLTQLAVIAGATSRVLLGTSVLVLLMRHPLYVAKIAATIDALAPGRVQLAVGAGWWKEEFELLDQRFEQRGRRMDEQIDILNLAWTQSPFEYHGEFYDFAPLHCRPLPAPGGRPRVFIGGMGAPALRRLQKRGDGWHVVGSDPTVLAKLRRQLDEFDRPLELSTSGGMSRDPERARVRLTALAEAGVAQIALNSDQPLEELIGLMTRYSEDVLPALR